MDKPVEKVPKVFISYCWTTREHQNVIIDWAKRLTADGVDVVLDVWSLKTGHDKYAFMEKMVTDSSVSKVLIFSDAEYARKANARDGGVGTESQIISKEIYEKVEQVKFVPIVLEFGDDGPSLPVFLKSRIWIDFSTPEKANEGYDQVLRAIFDKPIHQKPAIGSPPKHLFEPATSIPSCRPSLNAFKTAVLNDRSNCHGLAVRFLDDFVTRLGQFLIWPSPPAPVDDAIITSLEHFLPFRDDFAEFIKVVCCMKDEVSIYEAVGDCFEQSLRYLIPPDCSVPWNDDTFDNIRFIQYELFLYTIGSLIKYKRFDRAAILFGKMYFLPEKPHPRNFSVFCAFCKGLAARNQRLNLNRADPEADLIKKRATLPGLPFEQIKQADCLCLLRSLIHFPSKQPWYPHTVVFTEFTAILELCSRAMYKKEFLKLAKFLDVASKEELIEKYSAGAAQQKVNQWVIGTLGRPDFDRLFNFHNLDTL